MVAQVQIGPHQEQLALDVTNIGQHPVILGIPWLTKHNPSIEWPTRSVTFDDCFHVDPEKDELPVVRGWKGGQPARISEINGTSISARVASEHKEEKKTFKEIVPKEF